MTETKRIFLNIIATYGRSLFAMACGLFTSRWAIMALGEVDYGLAGVVTCLAAFVAFFNSLFSSAVARFYAFAVGEASVGDSAEGLEKCRKWFNTALLIHLFIPFILLLIGYPIGEYAIRHWLTIPFDRIEPCVWVFRYCCLACFVGMVGVPFVAMYTAKQYIAELTIYSFVQSSVLLVVLYFMASHPGDWLARYGFWTSLINAVPQLIIAWRATKVFPECRICRRYFWDLMRVKELLHFASWQFFGNFGYLIKAQGMAILVNKLFGPRFNASMSVANLIATQTGTLTTSMNGAFAPAITNLAGAGESTRMLNLSYRTCKFGILLSLLFVLPLSLELDYVLKLWLKTPPPLLAPAALLTMATLVVEESVRGIGLAVTAKGRIALYYFLLGTLNVLTLPVAWLWVWAGWGGFTSVFGVVLVIRLVAAYCSAELGKALIGFSPAIWFRRIIVPSLVISVVSLVFGWSVRQLMDEGFLRLVIVAGATVAVYGALVWWLGLAEDEKLFLREKIWGRFRKCSN